MRRINKFQALGTIDRANNTSIPKSRKPLTVKQIIRRMSDMKVQSDRAKLEKAPNQDLKDMSFLCPFKIMIESQDSKYSCIKDH